MEDSLYSVSCSFSFLCCSFYLVCCSPKSDSDRTGQCRRTRCDWWCRDATWTTITSDPSPVWKEDAHTSLPTLAPTCTRRPMLWDPVIPKKARQKHPVGAMKYCRSRCVWPVIVSDRPFDSIVWVWRWVILRGVVVGGQSGWVGCLYVDVCVCMCEISHPVKSRYSNNNNSLI